MIRVCVASCPTLLRQKTGSLVTSRHGVGMMEDGVPAAAFSPCSSNLSHQT